MVQDINPYAAPEQKGTLATSSNRRRNAMLFGCVCLGIIVGSYISAELLYFHHEDQLRSLKDVLSHTFAGIISSPISMSFGILPTLKFFGLHGFLIFPGIVMTLVGTCVYRTNENPLALVAVFVGCILWAHNNYLSFAAMMSV